MCVFDDVVHSVFDNEHRSSYLVFTYVNVVSDVVNNGDYGLRQFLKISSHIQSESCQSFQNSDSEPIYSLYDRFQVCPELFSGSDLELGGPDC